MDLSRLPEFLLGMAAICIFALAAGGIAGWAQSRRIARQLDERDDDWRGI